MQVPPPLPTAQEIDLLPHPEDGITNVVFAGSSDSVLASSWDKCVRLYDATKNVLLTKYEHKAAVLDCCFSADDTKAFSGGLDKSLVMYDFKSGKSSAIGSHEQAIRCVNWSSSGAVFTGSWDATVKTWDPRAGKPLTGSYTPQDGAKIYSMSLVQNKLVVATSTRSIVIYDVRQMSHVEQVRESSLQHQTRCVRIFPDATGYALSSIEGRVAIENFDPSAKVQKNKYAFKCHRKTVGKAQTVFPVNCIAFHPKYGTFATGGCDATVSIWDGVARKRICAYTGYPTSIASLAFNASGTLLAIAASYTFEEGEKDHPADSILIRPVDDNEVKPKAQVSTQPQSSASTSSSQAGINASTAPAKPPIVMSFNTTKKA